MKFYAIIFTADLFVFHIFCLFERFRLVEVKREPQSRRNNVISLNLFLLGGETGFMTKLNIFIQNQKRQNLFYNAFNSTTSPLNCSFFKGI